MAFNLPSRDLRLGLVEASEGKIGTPVDQVLLFCYHYDPVHRKIWPFDIAPDSNLPGPSRCWRSPTLILVLYKKEHYALPERRT
jgi:hypothetical protein